MSYSDEERLRREIHELVKARDKSEVGRKMKLIVTNIEYLERQKMGLPMSGYTTLARIKRSR